MTLTPKRGGRRPAMESEMEIIYQIKVSHGSTVGCVMQMSDGRLVVCDLTECKSISNDDLRELRQIIASLIGSDARGGTLRNYILLPIGPETRGPWIDCDGGAK